MAHDDTTPDRRLRAEVAVCLALVASCLIAYHWVRDNGFIDFDDPIYVSENPVVAAGLTVEGVCWAFDPAGHGPTYWHPLTWLSHMVDCELFGLDPGLHHLMALLFHTVNALLLFAFLRWGTAALWRSAFVAAVFALHPLAVESVVWASERKNLLSTTLWLLTLIAWIAYSHRPNAGRYAVALVVFALGLLAKPILVTVPCVLLLLDLWPLGRLAHATDSGHAQHDQGACPQVSLTRAVGEKVPLVALAIATLFFSPTAMETAGIVVSTDTVPLDLRIGNALVSYCSYIGKIVAPHGLAPFYPFPASVPLLAAAAAGLLLLGITAVVLWQWRRRPYLVVGWLWFVGTLAPASGLYQAGLWPAMADRWVYVPMIGFLIGVTWAGGELVGASRARPAVVWAASLILLIALLTATSVQVMRWRSNITLFEHAARVTRDNPIAHTNLGCALVDEGRLDEAVGHLRTALLLNPNSAKAHNGLGIALARSDQLPQAVHHFETALAIDPDLEGVRDNLDRVREMLSAPR